MCYGIRSSPTIDKGRNGGAGPADGRHVLLPGTITPSTNVPFQGSFINNSPYHVERLKQGYPFGSYLLYEGEDIIRGIQIVERARFLEKKTSTGIPMYKVVALHGTETIGVTVNKNCTYWGEGRRCEFCTIQRNIKTHQGKSLAQKTPCDVAEAILEAERNGFCKHVTLTSGSQSTLNAGPEHYIPYLKEVKEATSTPIHAQFEPPIRILSIGELYEAGADSVGIHIETLDEEVRDRVCPGKGRISKARYFKAWKEALAVFGENQVSTFILIGLGEDKKETVKELESLVSLGVIPYVVPVRPLLGSSLESASPPKPEVMFEIIEYVAVKVKEYGLKPKANKAGCIRCGACSPLMEALNYGV